MTGQYDKDYGSSGEHSTRGHKGSASQAAWRRYIDACLGLRHGWSLMRMPQQIRLWITGSAKWLEEWCHQDTRSWRVQPRACTAARSKALHAAHKARGDGIGKREKVAWVVRDWRDKGRGLLDVAQETYKLTACTTIEKQWSYPQFLRSLKSKRLSIGSEFFD